MAKTKGRGRSLVQNIKAQERLLDKKIKYERQKFKNFQAQQRAKFRAGVAKFASSITRLVKKSASGYLKLADRTADGLKKAARTVSKWDKKITKGIQKAAKTIKEVQRNYKASQKTISKGNPVDQTALDKRDQRYRDRLGNRNKPAEPQPKVQSQKEEKAKAEAKQRRIERKVGKELAKLEVERMRREGKEFQEKLENIRKGSSLESVKEQRRNLIKQKPEKGEQEYHDWDTEFSSLNTRISEKIQEGTSQKVNPNISSKESEPEKIIDANSKEYQDLLDATRKRAIEQAQKRGNRQWQVSNRQAIQQASQGTGTVNVSAHSRSNTKNGVNAYTRSASTVEQASSTARNLLSNHANSKDIY